MQDCGEKVAMRIEIPPKAQFILDTIAAAGFEAYVVGGCVRDCLLGRVPQDWDIAASAEPGRVQALFRHTIATGIQHGTVTVMLEGDGFEITTYRIDGKYKDGRHPDEVTFTPCLMEDLRRRDFTINAMAYSREAGLVDLFGGLADLRAKRIRCVGNAEERFGEDALRMLRAIRFSAQLGYEIEESTGRAIVQMAEHLRQISAERIQAELVKLLISDHPDYLRKAYQMGVTRVILPEFDAMMETPQNHPHHQYSVGEHTLHALSEVEPDKDLRLAMLLHDVAKPQCLAVDENGISHFHGHPAVGERMAHAVLKRLRFDNATIHTVCRLVQYHDYGNADYRNTDDHSGLKQDMKMVRRAINRVGEDIFPKLLQVKRADVLAQSRYLREEKLQNIARWESLYEAVLAERQCTSLKDLAVTGADLIAAGRKPGKGLGDILNALLELVLEHPEYNRKDLLLEKAREFP